MEYGFKITEDLDCIIIYNHPLIKIYYNLENNEFWVIVGLCNKCGKCLPKDWLEIPNRKDIPVRPEISKEKECSLRGEYL